MHVEHLISNSCKLCMIKLTARVCDNHCAVQEIDPRERAVLGKTPQASHLLDHGLLQEPFSSSCYQYSLQVSWTTRETSWIPSSTLKMKASFFLESQGSANGFQWEDEQFWVYLNLMRLYHHLHLHRLSKSLYPYLVLSYTYVNKCIALWNIESWRVIRMQTV